jgi:hypothetical protein
MASVMRLRAQRREVLPNFGDIAAAQEVNQAVREAVEQTGVLKGTALGGGLNGPG